MTLEIHKGLLHGYIQNLYDEGFVNDQFYQVQAMKQTGRKDYAVRSITNYCTSAKNLLTQLNNHSKQADVDFDRVNVLAHELYGKSIIIGAETVKVACVDLIRASDQYNKQNYLEALSGIKNEFSHLRKKFETVVKMERKIIELSGGQ